MTYQPVFLNPNPAESNGLNSAYSFDNFTLNEANKVAAETARQVSRNVGQSYNSY
jgi:chromosomal replication initiation ATPase DnaA